MRNTLHRQEIKAFHTIKKPLQTQSCTLHRGRPFHRFWTKISENRDSIVRTNGRTKPGLWIAELPIVASQLVIVTVQAKKICPSCLPVRDVPILSGNGERFVGHIASQNFLKCWLCSKPLVAALGWFWVAFNQVCFVKYWHELEAGAFSYLLGSRPPCLDGVDGKSCTQSPKKASKQCL